ncbi:steryl acetyl hydrolase [Aerococcus urinaeequi]|uniref:steryl acetyl hydrolase n=1 Tax=Aerococcus urinaeequi TaxID=51665 RepID=UPI003D6B9C01
MLGDSTGGTLVASFMQQLGDHELPLPSSVILIAPILDGTLQNYLVAMTMWRTNSFYNRN